MQGDAYTHTLTQEHVHAHSHTHQKVLGERGIFNAYRDRLRQTKTDWWIKTERFKQQILSGKYPTPSAFPPHNLLSADVVVSISVAVGVDSSGDTPLGRCVWRCAPVLRVCNASLLLETLGTQCIPAGDTTNTVLLSFHLSGHMCLIFQQITGQPYR